MKMLKLLVAATILAVSSTAMAELGSITGTYENPNNSSVNGTFTITENSEGNWTEANGTERNDHFVANILGGGNDWVDASTVTGGFGSIFSSTTGIFKAEVIGALIGGDSHVEVVGDGTFKVFIYDTVRGGGAVLETYIVDANGNKVVEVIVEEDSEEEVVQAQPIDTGYVLMTATMKGVKEMIIMYIDMRDGKVLGKPMVLQFFGKDHNWNESYETIYMDMEDMPEDTEVLMTSFK